MKNISLLFTILLASSCTSTSTNDREGKEEAPVHHSASISKVFQAHGGYRLWDKMNRLAYDMESGEHQLISLEDRKTLIESTNRTIGFDGKNVWVSPDTVKADNARFYHNLYFYFFAMPFVLGDPGIRYEDLEPKEIMGKKYGAVKVSFESGVGDSPKDNYILYYDQETNQMEWLMYTVTYFSKKSADSYNLIRYSDWAEYNGLRLPVNLQWYQYKDGEVGDPSGAATFSNVVISDKQPDDALFEMPDNARIAE